MECTDYLEFQDVLKKMREVDDKIIYALNVSIPTESFTQQIDASNTCKELYTALQTGNNKRETAIKNCITASAERLKTLKEQRDSNEDDFNISKKFKSEQRKLRLLQSELSVEEVLRQRTTKIFNERCRLFYKPEVKS